MIQISSVDMHVYNNMCVCMFVSVVVHITSVVCTIGINITECNLVPHTNEHLELN